MIQYGKTQPLWLKRLRAGRGNDPFFFINIMLPGFGRTLNSGLSVGNLDAVDTHSWAIIRDAQMNVLKLPRTAVVNTVDLGDEKKIHPTDKMPVGERAARLARREVYGESGLLAAGPMFQSLKVSGQKIVIRFKDAKGLSTSDGEPPRAFWLLGSDESGWKPAMAKIVGETVELTIPQGMKPKAIRYAFAAKPNVNLVNQDGLPAYPFQQELSR
jgi:sialate O-acetylesterase